MCSCVLLNLTDINGIVEINGLKFDPKDILKALVEQGLKVHSLNGALLIGRSFIDQSPDIKIGEESCSMSPYCKIYDRIHSGNNCKTDVSSSSTAQTHLESLSPFPLSFQTEPDKTYVERVEIDNNDINITNLFGNSPSKTSAYSPLPFNDLLSSEDDLSSLSDYISEPTEMMGLSPLTKYGPSKIDLESIPPKYRGKCPHCGITININWKFCGKCGHTM